VDALVAYVPRKLVSTDGHTSSPVWLLSWNNDNQLLTRNKQTDSPLHVRHAEKVHPL